jgi:hypothetical protein
MKNTFKISMLACFLFIATGALRAQSVSYKVVEDNPGKDNLHINILPFYVDYAGGNNLSLGYGLQSSVQLKKKWTFQVYYEHPYAAVFDWGYHFATVGIFTSPTNNVPVHFMHLELGGVYELWSKTKQKTRRVVLSSYSTGRYTHTEYIRVPATVLRSTGVRGGLYSYHTSITARQNGTVAGDLGGAGVISSDGTRFGGAANLNNGNTPEDPNFNTESATNMRVLGVYGGISLISKTRIIIDAEGYGERGMGKVFSFYADAIIAPVRIDRRPFGCRVGYDYNFSKKAIGYYAKTEIGFTPGLSHGNLYAMLAFGMSINGHVKALN